MKLTIESHMKWMAQYAGGTLDLAVLSDNDVDYLAPLLMSKLQEQANAIGYDRFKGSPHDYPDIVWVMIYNSIVKDVVLNWIDETCPKAWFKPLYLSKSEQVKLKDKK